MGFLQAVVLGAVQGATEFLPVSSSAHLIAVPQLFGWPDQGLAVDAALHLGTLLALIVYFWRDWLDILLKSENRRLLAGIALATVPAAVAGLLLEDLVRGVLRGTLPVAVDLILFGLLLGAADRVGKRTRSWDSLDIKTCVLIGLAQALALFPGVSRSGITITAGLFLGLRREDAARFSFLMAMPIVLGAGLLEARHLGNEVHTAAFWTAFAAAALSGFAVIAFFLRYLRSRALLPFVIYRVALGLGLLISLF